VRGFSFADGSDFNGSRTEYTSGYREQVQFIASRLRQAIERVLARRANRDIVMILQGDHGPGSMTDWTSASRTNLWERLSIFSAYRLPGRESVVYPSITPVNTFRVVFNAYLGVKFASLEDRSYFSTWNRPYDFVEVR
jgi:hypothetical protein